MSRARVAPQRGAAFELRRGDSLLVVDPMGGQVADLFCLDEATRRDALSSGRSIDYNETIQFGIGHVLYGQCGHPMLRLIEDTCGCHDFLVTPCSLQMFQMMSGSSDFHPSCLDNLATHLSHFGVESHQIGTTFNVFMNVPIGEAGRISVQPPKSVAGAFVRFEAMMDLVVGLTACADEGSNGGSCKPIEYEVMRGSAA